MAVGRRNIEIIRGDDYSNVIRLKIKTGYTTVPIDITDRVYQAQIRKSEGQVAIDATFVTVVTDAPNGEITIYLGHDATRTLTVGCYHWDLQQDTSGVLNTILRGKVTIKSDVTRP